MKRGFTYIMSNKNRTTLYIGVTSNIEIRALQHKCGIGGVFTKRYQPTYLIYFEEFDDMQSAIDREKQLKRWHRDWKLNLIKEKNPELKDLAAEWYTVAEIESFKKYNM